MKELTENIRKLYDKNCEFVYIMCGKHTWTKPDIVCMEDWKAMLGADVDVLRCVLLMLMLRLLFGYQTTIQQYMWDMFDKE